MAILAQAVADRMRSALDAEGTDHYRDDLDIIPAINNSITWMVNVVNSVMGTKKMPSEVLRELVAARIWQTNGFSRFSYDETVVGNKLWTVVSLHPKPTVYQPSFDVPQDFPSHSANFHAHISANQNSETENGPILDRDPVTWSFLEKHNSIFRPELAYVKSDFDCARLTHEEYVRNAKNPFAPGNEIKGADCDDVRFAYLDPTDYNTVAGGYDTVSKYEFEIRPKIPYQLVCMVYVKVPSEITALTDSIEFPASFLDMITSRALQVISYKQGDGTNIYSVSQRDIQALLTAIA